MTDFVNTILQPQIVFNKKPSVIRTIFMLFSRTFSFITLQLIIFAILSISGKDEAFKASGAWWPLIVTAANLFCAVLLYRFLKRDDQSFKDFFRFNKGTFGKDLLWALIFFIIAGPIAMLPNMVLGNILFGNYITASQLLFLPLPMWAAAAQLILFPVTMALGELTTYFGYVMPRMEVLIKSKVLGILLPALLLSLQHLALPLILDWRFMLWRGIMFLPFAVYIGIVIRFKPRMMPYLLIGHVLIDISTAVLVMTGV